MTLLDRLRKAEGPSRESAPVDPYNPWPIGCEWWHLQNEHYRKSLIRIAAIQSRTGG